MQNKNKRIILLFGGEHEEHTVSLQSAKNVYDAVRENGKYDILSVGIDRTGIWYIFNNGQFLKNETSPTDISLNIENALNTDDQTINASLKTFLDIVCQDDVVFSVIHGRKGEDGSIQGFLETVGIPYIGAGVLGSSICMDKGAAKAILRDSGFEVSDSITLRKSEANDINFSYVKTVLGDDLFIKPSSSGSSVGVNKVTDVVSFHEALSNAFAYDDKVIIEKNIKGREIECAVLGGESTIVSLPGEILAEEGFYSYQEKYLTEAGSNIQAPAELSSNEIKELQNLAEKVYKTLECYGMARVDFFLTPESKIIVNEVNTLPGFTEISMFPMLMDKTGVPYSLLIDKLISLALNEHTSPLQEKQKL